jgi:K+ transporter
VVTGIAILVLMRVAFFVLTRPHSILFPEFTLLAPNWQLAASLLLGMVAATIGLRAKAAGALSLVSIAVICVLLASSTYLYVFYTPVSDQAIADLWVK